MQLCFVICLHASSWHGGLGDLGDQGNQHIGHSVSAAQERECNWWRGLQVTYPLDTLRLRLAVDPAARSISGTARALMREGSHGAFFRGLGASMIGQSLPQEHTAGHLPRPPMRQSCRPDVNSQKPVQLSSRATFHACSSCLSASSA